MARTPALIPAHIAEGAGKTGTAEAASSYVIARGSAMECAAALDRCRLLPLVDEPLSGDGISLLERIVAMLTRLWR